MQIANMMEVDGIPVKIEGERNLLEVISKTGVKMPVFCYHSDLSIYGACRMCMVEDDAGRLMAACSTLPKAGMKIRTNTGRLRKYRKNILELLLASHNRDCTTCEKSGRCTLQELAAQFGITNVRFANDKTTPSKDESSPSIVRDSSKCILCGDCVRECNTCEIAPAVRVGIGEELGLGNSENAMGRIIAALHRMGFDMVYDTVTGADLTVIEEANEFVERVQNNGTLPLFTSCCPAWIQFAEKKHPELLPNISTCRSPMGMFAAVIKEYYKDRLPEGKTSHYHVALMPCTAKKFEAKRDEFKTEMGPNTDDVITTQELIRMIKRSGIMFNELEPEAVDLPFGTMSGAGMIFGVTGGVTEAVLRKIATDSSRTTLKQIEYTGVRGMDSVKEATIPFGDREVRIAVVSGLGNAEQLIKKLRDGSVQYDLVEVMACRGGCISGAGQPYISQRHRVKRAEGLYRSDKVSTIKRSQDNPLMEELYNGVLKDRVHELLHVDYVKK